jgi:hypothetical protein
VPAAVPYLEHKRRAQGVGLAVDSLVVVVVAEVVEVEVEGGADNAMRYIFYNLVVDVFSEPSEQEYIATVMNSLGLGNRMRADSFV